MSCSAPAMSTKHIPAATATVKQRQESSSVHNGQVTVAPEVVLKWHPTNCHGRATEGARL